MRREIIVAQWLMLIALLSGGVSCGNSGDSNRYMDAVINQYLRHETRKIDPKPMPDIDTSFKTSFTHVNVKTTYSRGTLTGLSTVRRVGECSSPYWSYGNSTINCTLTFDDLKLKYNLRGKYGVLPSVSSAVAELRIKDPRIVIQTSSNHIRSLPTLRVLSVLSVGSSTADFSNLSTLRPAKDSLKKSFISHSLPYVTSVLNGEFWNAVAISVGKLTMPFP